MSAIFKILESTSDSGYYLFFLFTIATVITSIIPRTRFYVLSAILLNGLIEYMFHKEWIVLPPQFDEHDNLLILNIRLVTLGFSFVIIVLGSLFGRPKSSTNIANVPKRHKKPKNEEYNLRVIKKKATDPIEEVENKYAKQLEKIAKDENISITSDAFAKHMDENDPLREVRKEFAFPKGKELYFTGNSLGLQPHRAQQYMKEELDKWANLGVNGHFEEPRPWFEIDEYLKEKMAKIVGAKPDEVAVMNSLTANLHFLLVAFYRPTPSRHKILIEENPFPSDMYAVLSQIRYHGYDPEESLIQVGAREGEEYIRTEDILEVIEKEGDSIALILFSGVHFLTGQAFEIEKIVEMGHKKNCIVGFDLAHAVGNLKLKLHDWNVDFACWCNYKYLNSGPGAIAGAFVHERFDNEDLPRFEGWWGNKKETRFKMKTRFEPQPGASGFALSNPSIFSIAPVIASLEIFDKIGMDKLRQKSTLLTSYLEILLKKELGDKIKILTPQDPEQRGCQLSVQMNRSAKEVEEELQQLGVVTDRRDPDVIRIAPVPLYNSFYDVYLLIKNLKIVLNK